MVFENRRVLPVKTAAMIKVIYLPNRLSQKGRIEKLGMFSRERVLSDCLRELEDLPPINLEDFDIIVSGRLAKSLDEFVNDKSEIIVSPKIKGPMLLALPFVAAYYALPLVAIAVNSSANYLLDFAIYRSVTASRMKSGLSIGGGDESSPTYGWEGIHTMRDIGIPVPIIYGEHKVGGNVINEYIWTDGDKNYLNTLLSLGEGEIESISDIKINDNPIANFDGISYTTKMGTNSQSVIPNFSDLHNIVAVNVQLTKNNAYVYTTGETDVEGFELKLQLPSGLYQQADDGSIQAWDVVYQVEYKLHTDGSYTDLGSTTISGMSRSTLRRVFRKDGLTAGQYDIRVTRTSDDTSLTPNKTGDLYLESVDEIKTDDLSYPNTALLGLKLLATEQLSGSSPNITCVVRGLKISIPQVMNGATAVDWEDYYWDPDYNSGAGAYRLLSDDTVLSWDGSTYAAGWSANPVWCIRDLLTKNRYGLGEFIATSDIDSALWVEMSRYCDEKIPDGAGGYEKRFRLDVVLDSASQALEAISQLTATLNGFVFYSGGEIKIRIDKELAPVQLFGMGNMVVGSFAQSWGSLKDKPNFIEIQFLDAEKDYEQETIAVIDEEAVAAGEPLRKKQLRLFTTSVTQALRIGRYALKVAKYINRSVSFKAAVDAIACQVGDIVDVSHDVPQWGFSGRVQAGATTTSIPVDQPITIETGKTYLLQVRFPDNTLEERTVTNVPGTYTTLTTSAFSQAPSAYDIYAFGETDIQSKPFRVVAMSRDNKNEVSITAIEYDAAVYDDTDVTLPTSNYSALSWETKPVTSLVLSEHLVKLKDGTIECAIDVWFAKPTLTASQIRTYQKAKIYLSDDGGASWILRGETTGTYFVISGGLVDGVEYTVAVVAVTSDGQEESVANSPQDSITLSGKSAAPSAVSSFIARQSRDRLSFFWTAVSDLDLSAYEIRYGSSWASGELVATGIKQNSLLNINLRVGTDQSYWIKAIDTSGNYSDSATEALITIDNIPFTNVIESYSEQTAWSGTKTNTEVSGGSLVLSSGELTGTYVTAVKDIGFVATCKIGIESIVVNAGSDATWDEEPDGATWEELPDSDRWSGTEAPNAASFEIKTSEDNSTWSDWQAWQPGDYKLRYFQIRMTMTRPDESFVLQCSQLNYYADLPDVDDFGDAEVTVAADGVEVVFAKDYHQAPAVNIAILTGDGVVHKFTSAPDTTGFTVKLYDLAGTAKTGTLRWHSHGV